MNAEETHALALRTTMKRVSRSLRLNDIHCANVPTSRTDP